MSFPTSTPAHARVQVVDAVKGVAIVLMVLGHVEQGAMNRALWAATPGVAKWVSFADDFIYSFHMPAFFFVSGLFLASSAARRGSWDSSLKKREPSSTPISSGLSCLCFSIR